MTKEKKKQIAKNFSNDVLRGKPHLDIDRVIPHGKPSSKLPEDKPPT